MARTEVLTTWIVILGLLVAHWASHAHGQSFLPPLGGNPFQTGSLIPPIERLPPAAPYVDLDSYVDGPASSSLVDPEALYFQILPKGLVYEPYLAGTKESRFSTHIISARQDNWLMDATLGARTGLLRYGTLGGGRPEGFQIDAEGSAQLRLDIPEEKDLRSVDFRAGLPMTYGFGRHRTKFAYYHLSSHLGDEFLLKNPEFERLNYSRDVLVLGHAVYMTDRLRIYGEAGWSFHEDISERWEFQIGADYAPVVPTGIYGAPFFAVNGHLREEVGFGGGLTVQAGWAWRSEADSGLLRTGLHYYNGQSNQFSFFNDHEQQIGFGVWYDYF